MKGDREKCIEAGAWDYLSKPVNRDDLVAVLYAWLHRQERL
jgi:CheY-like chemotaxis protein